MQKRSAEKGADGDEQLWIFGLAAKSIADVSKGSSSRKIREAWPRYFVPDGPALTCAAAGKRYRRHPCSGILQFFMDSCPEPLLSSCSRPEMLRD